MPWTGGVADPPACSTLDWNQAKNPCLLCSAAAYCCGAVGPRPIAALLGRFLPRLGPLVHSSGPFFFWALCRSEARAEGRAQLRIVNDGEWCLLLRRRLERPEIAERHLCQRVGERGEIGGHLGKAGPALAPPLVHVDRAVEFELHGVQSARRVAVMLGDETAGIRLVAADRIAEPAHDVLDDIGQK